jgi:alpha-beta hydrolase superfamily lysophospholipase
MGAGLIAMRAEHFTFTADDWAQLYVYCWLPDDEGDTKAVVHIAHGLAEHAGRYEHVARFLVTQGYAVYANDQRGHGRTAKTPAELGHLADTDGWQRIAKDLVQMCTEEKQKHEGLPLILLGHSLGAQLAQQMAYEQGDLFDAIAMSGPNGKVSPLAHAGKLIARFERLRLGKRGRSQLINRLSFAEFNKNFAPNRTAFDWLSRDAAEVDKYINDPLCGFIATTQTWVDILDAMTEIAQPGNRARIRKDLPLYLFSGHHDPVNEFGNGLEALVEAYRNQGVRSVRFKLYPAARHETFNETNCLEVLNDLLDWLNLVVIQAGEKILAR